MMLDEILVSVLGSAGHDEESGVERREVPWAGRAGRRLSRRIYVLSTLWKTRAPHSGGTGLGRAPGAKAGVTP